MSDEAHFAKKKVTNLHSSYHSSHENPLITQHKSVQAQWYIRIWARIIGDAFTGLNILSKCLAGLLVKLPDNVCTDTAQCSQIAECHISSKDKQK